MEVNEGASMVAGDVAVKWLVASVTDVYEEGGIDEDIVNHVGAHLLCGKFGFNGARLNGVHQVAFSTEAGYAFCRISKHCVQIPCYYDGLSSSLVSFYEGYQVVRVVSPKCIRIQAVLADVTS